MAAARPVAYDARMDDGGMVRDRVLAAGGAECTDAELLGVLLDGGVGGPVAVDRAASVLRATGGLRRIDRGAPPLAEVLGPRWRRRAAVLRAALELGRRAAGQPLEARHTIRDAAAVWAHFRGRLPQLDREHFFVLLLDGRNRVQGEVHVSEGTLTAALVHPREVFTPAIRGAAAAIILVHNHPSGDPAPSPEDTAITERLRQAGELLGIRVLDHVIVGQARYASMAEAGQW